MGELAFRGVCKRFPDGTHALADVDFVAPSGGLTAVLGPSGSGKSTLLRIAAGLERQSSGAVLFDGRPLDATPRQRRSIAFLSQAEQLFPHLDVLANVTYGLAGSGMPEDAAARHGRATLEMLGLVGYERRTPDELSGGQRQRVALARALVLDPRLVLLDEPLANLDTPLSRLLRAEIRAIQRTLRLTMLYVTHDHVEAMAIGDHLVLMHDGRVVQQGTPRDLYANPASEYVAASLGDTQVLEGRVVAPGTVRLGPFELRGVAGCGPVGSTAKVLVRPQAWRLSPVGGRGGAPGRILRRAYLGRTAEYAVDTDLGEVLACCAHAGAMMEVGAPVDVALDALFVKILPAAG